MMIAENLNRVRAQIQPNTELVAVSKYHPVEELQEAYDAGQRVFGESHVQELVAKHEVLPQDIRWHFIGHLQTNKVKYIVPFVSLIHSADSVKLLREINKQGQKVERVVDVLLQLHVAEEETKFGFTAEELVAMLEDGEWRVWKYVRMVGVMAMATNTDDEEQIAEEFERVHNIFRMLKDRFFVTEEAFKEISMGMSGDYLIAQAHGSTMVRVGSMIFGERDYSKSFKV